jgi:phosphohistidine phosphatase
MRLYFYRHAPALSRAEWDGIDSERPLSTDGAETASAMSKHIAGMELTIDAIVSSPFVRAWRTAEILAEEIAAPPLVADRGLEPAAFDRKALEAIIDAYADAAGLVIIGHEPSMTAVIADVIGGGDMVLKKAGLARVDLFGTTTPATGTLRWLIPPKLLP